MAAWGRPAAITWSRSRCRLRKGDARVSMNLFATHPLGFSDLVEQEVLGCGGQITARTTAGVGFEGSLECAYRMCLWSRVANRILLQIRRVRRAGAGCAVLRHSAHRLADASSPRRFDRGRLRDHAFADQPQLVRRAARERRDRRSTARGDRNETQRRPRDARRADQRLSRSRSRFGVDRPVRPESASPRLSADAGCRAA